MHKGNKNGVTRCHFINFVQRLFQVMRHLIIGPGPCIFEILKYRMFLEFVCVGKQELGLVSDPSSKGPEIPPSLHIYNPQGIVQTLGFVQTKISPQLQLRVLRLCPTTRPRRHRTPPSLIKLSSFICNIQIAISVSCLFFICSQETDPRGQVGHAPAWSITPWKLVQQLLRRDISHVHSRIIKVDSH